MIRIFFALIFLGIILRACEIRPLPDGQDGDVRFELEAKLGEKREKRKAGFDGQFLFTGYDLEDELLIYKGKFGEEGCESCPNSIEIRFRDLNENIFPDAVHLDTVLKLGEKEFFVQGGVEGRKRKKVSFTNESRSLGTPNYRWNFGDGNTSTALNPVHTYEDPDLTEVTVCLETLDANGCTTEICNTIRLEDSVCAVGFSHSLSPNSTYVEFQAEASGTPPFEYSWDFGDGGKATLGNPGYFYAEEGAYEACLTVTDALGCVSNLCKKIQVDPNLCEHNFSYQLGSAPSKDLKQFGRIEIVYVDENGKVFRSSGEDQPESSYFEILNREPYQKNANGISTYAFACNFACMLWDENGNAMELSDGQAESAVGYP